MRLLSALLLCCLIAGCPAPDEPADNGEAGSDASFVPSVPIPADDPLARYDKLWLGMDSLAMAQAYNAPQGKGDGFNRMIQQFGDVAHHVINFDKQEGQPLRRIVASFYRDQLYIIVDRREGITLAQRDEWFNSLVSTYGAGYSAVLPTSQWSWGDEHAVQLTFTQDNASADLMNANLVLVHGPTRSAAHDYLVLWEKEHPQEPGSPAGDSGAGD